VVVRICGKKRRRFINLVLTTRKRKMFNKDDFENMEEKDPDTIPDGVVDASNYYEILRDITEYLEQTDYEDTSSRIVAIMNIINLMHEDEDTLSDDSVYGVCVALMYHLQTMLSGMVDEDKSEYFTHIKEEVLPTFKAESGALPYYNSDIGEDDE